MESTESCDPQEADGVTFSSSAPPICSCRVQTSITTAHSVFCPAGHQGDEMQTKHSHSVISCSLISFGSKKNNGAVEQHVHCSVGQNCSVRVLGWNNGYHINKMSAACNMHTPANAWTIMTGGDKVLSDSSVKRHAGFRYVHCPLTSYLGELERKMWELCR